MLPECLRRERSAWFDGGFLHCVSLQWSHYLVCLRIQRSAVKFDSWIHALLQSISSTQQVVGMCTHSAELACFEQRIRRGLRQTTTRLFPFQVDRQVSLREKWEDCRILYGRSSSFMVDRGRVEVLPQLQFIVASDISVIAHGQIPMVNEIHQLQYI